jgi:hypothetical protein
VNELSKIHTKINSDIRQERECNYPSIAKNKIEDAMKHVLFVITLLAAMLPLTVSAQRVEAQPVDSIFVIYDVLQDMTYWRSGKILLHYDAAEDNRTEVLLYAFEKGKHLDQMRPGVPQKAISMLLRYRWGHARACSDIQSFMLKYKTEDTSAFVPANETVTYKAYRKMDSTFLSSDSKRKGSLQYVWTAMPMHEFVHATEKSTGLVFEVHECTSDPVDDAAYVQKCAGRFLDHLNGKTPLVVVQSDR